MFFSADEFYYMILNHPITLHVGALNASNASITWDFITCDIKILVEITNGSYVARISNSSSSGNAFETINKYVASLCW